MAVCGDQKALVIQPHEPLPVSAFGAELDENRGGVGGGDETILQLEFDDTLYSLRFCMRRACAELLKYTISPYVEATVFTPLVVHDPEAILIV